MKIFMTAFMSALFFTTVAAVSNATEASILTCVSVEVLHSVTRVDRLTSLTVC